MNVVFLGPPGAGKGTQADLLSDRCGIPKYATGDILRDAVRRQTELGREARRYMDRGELVPDDVVLGLVREALDSPAARDGFLLDGFPRTVPQAEALTSLLAEQGRELESVVYFDVDEPELVRRLAGRRVCPECGSTYNVHSDPPERAETCDNCGARLKGRSDDDEPTVRNRLRVFRENTQPLLEWYRENGPRPERLDADGSVKQVHQRVLEILGCLDKA